MTKNKSITSGKEQRICPVCGKASYSKAGVHPQCSVKLVDEELASKQKEQAKESEDTKADKAVSRWQKLCPKCKSKQHVRKKLCDCGHSFG